MVHAPGADPDLAKAVADGRVFYQGDEAVNDAIDNALIRHKDRPDTGAHYRYVYQGIKMDPYRICRIYGMEGGPREHMTKKLLRGTRKGDSERGLIHQLRDALDRWEEMLDEDEAQ